MVRSAYMYGLTTLSRLSKIFSTAAGRVGPVGFTARAGKLGYSIISGTMAGVKTGGALLSQFNIASGAVESAKPVIAFAGAAGPILARLAIPIALVAGAVETIDHLQQGDNRSACQSAAYTVGGLSGIFAGAAAGGAIGSAVPFIGTAIGTVVGGVAGSLGGSVAFKFGVSYLYDHAQALYDNARSLAHRLQHG